MTDDSTFDFNRVLQKLSADEKTAEGAFKELYGRFAPVIYTRGKRTLRSSLLAKDLAQEVFLAVWMQRTNLTHVENFKFYLHGIITKMMLKIMKRARHAETSEKHHLEKLESQYDPTLEDKTRQIDHLIEKLPSPRNEIFISAKIYGVDGKLIAERINISYDAVRQHISRARKFLINHKRDLLTLFLSCFFALANHLLFICHINLF